MSAFDRLFAAGVLVEQPDRSDLVGSCPVCSGAIIAPIIGDGRAPRVICANGCHEDAMEAAASSTGDAAWLTEKLDLAADPLVKAERWGRHLTAPIDLVCASGRRIRFDEQRDLARPQVLASTVRSYTDGIARPALCSGSDAQEVLAVVLGLCGAIEVDESIAEAASWMAQFLSRHQVITGTLATPEGYWQALKRTPLCAVRPDRDDRRRHERAASARRRRDWAAVRPLRRRRSLRPPAPGRLHLAAAAARGDEARRLRVPRAAEVAAGHRAGRVEREAPHIRHHGRGCTPGPPCTPNHAHTRTCAHA